MVRAFLSQYMVYVALAAVVVAGTAGWKVRDWQCKAASVAVMERVAKEKDRMQEVIDAQSVAYEAARAASEVVSEVRTNTIREVYREVPVDVSCAPPPAVSVVLMDAVADANAAASGSTGQPSRAVPPAAASARPASGP
jgi:hypothetical protein